MANSIPLMSHDEFTEPASAGPTMRALTPAAVPRPVDLSVVIVSWNSERWIERCLRSLPAACEGLSYEVIVHDNASGDATLDRIDSLQRSLGGNAPQFRVTRSATNDGFAGGINRGIASSTGGCLFLLNPDCELGPRSLTILFDFLERHPEVAAAAPLLADERGDSQREFQLRRFPTLLTLAAEIFSLPRLMPRNRVTARHHYRDLDLSHPQRIDQPAAAALMIRKSAFTATGPLDEQFAPAWFEDVDYSRRMAARGLSVYVVPDAKARHFGGASLEHLSFEEFQVAWYRNMWLYARKWFAPAHVEALRWAIMAGMAMRFAASAAGLAHRDIGGRTAARAYARVLTSAWHRWGAS